MVLTEQSLTWEHQDFCHPLPCVLSSGHCPYLTFTGRTWSSWGNATPMGTTPPTPSLEQRRKAMWCSAKVDDLSLEMFSGDGLPPPEGCCAVPTSCSEPLFALENLNARKKLELSLPTTNPGPPYSSLHTTGAQWMMFSGFRQVGDLAYAPGGTHGVDLERSQENEALFPQVV